MKKPASLAKLIAQERLRNPIMSLHNKLERTGVFVMHTGLAAVLVHPVVGAVLRTLSCRSAKWPCQVILCRLRQAWK